MTWGDIEILVAQAKRAKVDPATFVATRCNVAIGTAEAWVRKVRANG